jgi:uncharacterized protein (TIGR03435 family)
VATSITVRLDFINNLTRWAVMMAVMIPTSYSQTSAPQTQNAPSQPTIAFNVVAIRENKDESSPRQLGFAANGDGLQIQNVPIAWIIQYAYNIQNSSLLSGAPDWTKSDGYNIQAKVDDSDLVAYHKLNDTQRKLMLQAVLKDRFKLTVHSGQKEVPTFALVVAKNGLKMKEVKPEEPHPDGPKKSDGTPFEGSACPYFSDHLNLLNCQATTMSTLAQMLSAVGKTGRQVMDKTSLTGTYDFVLSWTPEQTDSPASESPQESTGTSIFSSVQEQLGLKLNSSKDTFEMLVIDHIERPTDN